MTALPRVCVSVVEPTMDGAERATAAASDAGAFCEIRLDALDSAHELTVESLGPLCRRLPVLLTWRTRADGGRADVDDAWRLALLAECSARYGAMCDVEFSRVDRLAALGISPDLLVLSHHDVERTAGDLADILERMMKVPARVHKVATHARASSDQFVHFDLLARGRAAGRTVVAIAMGTKGVATRILGPAHGAPFTFCSLERGAESAPGQLTLDEVCNVYRVDRHSRQTPVLGLLAGSIEYSLSPLLHNRACAETETDAVYIPFEIDDLDGFNAAGVRGSRAGWNLRGLSVTNPFKQRVALLVDELDDSALRPGSVNTIVVSGSRIKGYNTDVAGVRKPLLARLGSLSGSRAAVIGTGGAAHAVLTALESLGAQMFVIGRDADRSAAVAARFGAQALGIDEIAGARLDLLVNATPVGTSGQFVDESPVPASVLPGIGMVFDLVYKPPTTRLLKDAERAGCNTMNGLEMLATQAAAQFELWTGKRVSTARMLDFAGGKAPVSR